LAVKAVVRNFQSAKNDHMTMMISLPVDPQVMCIELSENDQLWVTDDAYHITYILASSLIIIQTNLDMKCPVFFKIKIHLVYKEFY
jgi:hypothetical protein